MDTMIIKAHFFHPQYGSTATRLEPHFVPTMRFISVVATVLQIYLSALIHVAVIPAGRTSSAGFPSTNHRLIKETLYYLNHYEENPSTKRALTLQTFRPWPPAPFNFRDTREPTWFLRINAYDPPRLTFRQMHALLTICVDTQDQLKLFPPNHRMPEELYNLEATARTPFDLTQENVEIAFFNAADEPGAAYTAKDMYRALDTMLGRMLPKDIPDFSRTVLHYSSMELRMLRF
ncbi:MAG: hypothetical protein Q9226_004286 [Calogaya cf. arnoldii]